MGIPYETLSDRSVVEIIAGAQKGSSKSKTLVVKGNIDALPIREEASAQGDTVEMSGRDGHV